MNRSLRVLACAATAWAAWSSEARAETADEVRADALFREGMQRFDAGQVAAACAAFTESLRLDPKLGTLLNLALCHERQGKTATAWTEFNHGAAWATQNGQRDRREFANQHALTLEGQLSRVLLKLPPARELSSVEVDGEPLPEPRWYLPLYLDPGEHSIAVSAPGKYRRTVKVVVQREPTAQVVPVPALVDVEPPPPPPPKPKPSQTRRALTIASASLGVLGLGAGTALGIIALTRRDDMTAHCTGNVCDAQGGQLHDDAQRFALGSTIGFAAGLVGAAAFVTLVLTAPAEPKSGPEVRAFAGPRGAGVGGVF